MTTPSYIIRRQQNKQQLMRQRNLNKKTRTKNRRMDRTVTSQETRRANDEHLNDLHESYDYYGTLEWYASNIWESDDDIWDDDIWDDDRSYGCEYGL